MAVKLVLLHSPLVGPGSWRALAPILRLRGFHVVVPDFLGDLAGTAPYYAKLVRTARTAVGDDSDGTILVAHSGAGALVPAIAHGGLVRGTIFMDALLPHPGKSWLSTAPDVLKSRLINLTRNGRVATWQRWWPRGAIESLFGDKSTYENFVAELNDLPVAFLEEPAPSVELPQQLGCAYLQLSTGYEAEAATAEKNRWLVVRLALNHLAMLTHSNEVAMQLELLARSLATHTAPT